MEFCGGCARGALQYEVKNSPFSAVQFIPQTQGIL